MSVTENRLSLACKQVSDAAAEIMDWITSNGRLLGAERISLLHELHASEAMAERLALSANQAATVAFVGPRKSGKTSTAIPVIKGAGALTLRFDGVHDRVDYVAQIVPDTRSGLGATVRLSDKEKPAPRNFPIAVRLLSNADLVRILASAFLSDIAARDVVPTLDDVRRAREIAARKADPSRYCALTEEDVWEIRAWLAERHGNTAAFRALSAANYWQTLAKLGPQLPNEALGQLLSLLWGGLDALTRAFAGFAEILEGLNGSLEVNCALNALLSMDARTGKLSRRGDSVLAGSTINGISDDVRGGGEEVVVCNQFGLCKSIPRTGLAGLAAEVRLTLSGVHSPILANADVLEFPGLDTSDRSGNLVRTLLRDPDMLGSVFLRAKAQYLLDRAIVDHKITAMVVCVDPTVQEIGELAGLVQKWVENTHGADASVREQQDSALFIALTKIDKEILPKGRGEAALRDWDARLRTILQHGFGQSYDWPHEWVTGQAFDGVHLVRSPSVKSKQFCDYGTDGSELGFKPALKERIERAGLAFLASETVRRHVGDPDSIWREAMLLNDGGTSYLAQSIAEVANAHVKQRQLILALNGLRHGMKERLQSYFLSDSYAFQHGRRHTRALHIVRRLRTSGSEQRVGALLSALQIPDSELTDVLQALDVRPRAADANADSAAGLRAEALAYAQAAVDHWVKTVRALAANAAACQTYRIPRRALLALVDELVVGAVRLELESRIAETTARLAAEGEERRVSFTKAAMAASRLIAGYIMSLGFEDTGSNSHPRRKGKEQLPIFPERKAVDIATLATAKSRVGEFQADWSQAFLRLVDDNVAGLREREISDEQNRRLGRLLLLLDINL